MVALMGLLAGPSPARCTVARHSENSYDFSGLQNGPVKGMAFREARAVWNRVVNCDKPPICNPSVVTQLKRFRDPYPMLRAFVLGVCNMRPSTFKRLSFKTPRVAKPY